MASCLGGVFVCMGITKVIDMIVDANHFLGRQVRPIVNDSKCKQITRIIANIILFAAVFTLALGAFSLGSTLITVGAQAGFIMGFEAAIAAALPKLIVAVGGLAVGEIIKRLGQ